eukprot:UN24084
MGPYREENEFTNSVEWNKFGPRIGNQFDVVLGRESDHWPSKDPSWWQGEAPPGVDTNLDNCADYDIYEKVCTSGCVYEPVAPEDCPPTGCFSADESIFDYQFIIDSDLFDQYTELDFLNRFNDRREMLAFPHSVALFDGDCGLPACPMNPNDETIPVGFVCEADSPHFQNNDFEPEPGYFLSWDVFPVGNYYFNPDVRPGNVPRDLDNCANFDVVRKVCDVDCKGYWSHCSSACETADQRFYVKITEAEREGTPCPLDSEAQDCNWGEGTCTGNRDCEGSWSPCTAACEKCWSKNI